MSAFPSFSNIADYVAGTINSRKANNAEISKLVAWVRIASAAGGGCQMISNPSFPLFGNQGAASIYGFNDSSGTIGVAWNGSTAINAEGEFMGFRPKPNVSSIEIDEGAGNLSRKASFTITCYTKAQLDTVCKYFLEPGYTIFLEWGWNTDAGISQFKSALDASTVSNFQAFSNVNAARKAASGQYDNYLGFITGGSIGINGDTWEVNVKVTGFTELPAYLMVSDRIEGQEEDNKDKAQLYEPSEIDSQKGNLGKQRFMMMFNRLPSNRLSIAVSNMLEEAAIADPVNFINFDEKVKANINNLSDGWSFLGLFGGKGTVKTEGGKVETPEGTKIVGDYAYVRFGTLMAIINKVIEGGFKLANGKTINLKINTSRTVCSAFPKIFSTDKNKLFIPNPNTPKFSMLQASQSQTEQDDFSDVINNEVKSGEKRIIFPFDQAISGGQVTKNGETITIQQDDDGTFIGVSKNAGQFGFLDDLYVNIDFVKGIIETKNFSVKDALYQILNGLSSAAGGMWDFNIIESAAGDELYVVDLNLVADTSGTPIALDLIGTDSVFIDASLDLDISGAKMNQIIGNRLGKKINGTLPENAGKKKGLFTDMDDMVLTALESQTATNDSGTSATGQAGKAETEADKKKAAESARDANLQIFLDKVGYAPKIDLIESSTFSKQLEELTYVCAFNDQVIFQGLKNGNDKGIREKADSVSPLMPIKFTGTIHGVSGIKRGDKFVVNGLPKAYEGSGFFQVTAVKHIIEGMIWKTEIEGGFRREMSK